MSTPESLQQDVAVLRVDVDDLIEAIQDLIAAAGGSAAAAASSRWSWRDRGDVDAGTLWAELIDFVNWLVPRYGLAAERHGFPTCWFEHPVAVEELTALMVAWQAAYSVSTPSSEPAAWHDRWLWPCVGRLGAVAGWSSCIDRQQHQPPLLREWVPTVASQIPDPADLPDPS